MTEQQLDQPVEYPTEAHLYTEDDYVTVYDVGTGEESQVPKAWLKTYLGQGLTTTKPKVTKSTD